MNEIKKNSNPKLRLIIDTILFNKTIQKIIKLQINPDINLNTITQLSKPIYINVLELLGGNPSKMKIVVLLRSIMMKLPTNPVIENILDTQFSVSKIANEKDKNAVYFYLSKEI